MVVIGTEDGGTEDVRTEDGRTEDGRAEDEGLRTGGALLARPSLQVKLGPQQI